MKSLRVAAWVCGLALGLPLASACSSPDVPPGPGAGPAASSTPTAGPTSASASSAVPSSTRSGAPAATATPSAGPSGAPSPAEPEPTSADRPVPKVERSAATGRPTVSAEPTSVDGEVRYPDGVSLEVEDVKFGREKREGPGSFPGRDYAVLTLSIANKSSRALSMATVVVTVLDEEGAPVPPVSTDEVDVEDFSGTVDEGETTRAKYAFAVPRSSRSRVTVVVDFDGVHTSAVFRGKLG